MPGLEISENKHFPCITKTNGIYIKETSETDLRLVPPLSANSLFYAAILCFMGNFGVTVFERKFTEFDILENSFS